MTWVDGIVSGIFLVIPKILPRAGAEDRDRSRKRGRGGQLLLQQESRVKLRARHCGVPRLDKEVPGDRDPGCSIWPLPSFNPVTHTFYLVSGAVPRVGNVHLPGSLRPSRGRGPLLAWQNFSKAGARDLCRTTTLAGRSPRFGERRDTCIVSACLSVEPS